MIKSKLGKPGDATGHSALKDLCGGEVTRYSHHMFVSGIKLSDGMTIDENGIVSKGIHLFYATKEGAYKAAFRRAKKYHKANPGSSKFRFYFLSEDNLKKLTMFHCYGGLYRDTLRPFVRKCIRHIRYQLGHFN